MSATPYEKNVKKITENVEFFTSHKIKLGSFGRTKDRLTT